MSSLSIPFHVSLWAQTRIGKGIIISSGSVIRHVYTACTELLLSAPEVCCVFAKDFFLVWGKIPVGSEKYR
jgi:hypothetical protein